MEDPSKGNLSKNISFPLYAIISILLLQEIIIGQIILTVEREIFSHMLDHLHFLSRCP